MNKMKKENENALKSFLKRKVSYTAGLLVAFLISGSLGFAVSSDIVAIDTVSTGETYFSKLESEKTYVQELLKENQKQLANANEEYLLLLRKGDFYSKPIHGSTQIFFNLGYENAGRSKNRTTKEWSNTIEAIKYRMAGYTLDKGINPYHKGEVISKENGYQFSTMEDGSVYNPEASIYDEKYLKAAYAEDEYGNLISLAIPTGTSVYYTDVNGNNYYQVVDPSSGVTYVVNEKGVAVRTDALGDVVLESSLADKNINGNVPENGVAGLDTSAALNELYQGNGVYLEEVPYMSSLDIGANILPLDPDIPSVSKNVSVNVDAPVLGNIPSTPVAPNAPGAITTPGSLPSVAVTAPAAVNLVVVNTPNLQSPQISSVNPPNVTAPTVEVKIDTDIVTPPTAPVVSTPGAITVTPGSFKSVSAGNSTNSYFARTTGAHGVMASVKIDTGSFNIEKTAATNWSFTWSNYTGRVLIGSYQGTVANENLATTSLSGGIYTIDSIATAQTATGKNGFMLLNETPLMYVGSGVDVTLTRNSNFGEANQVRELVHMDFHNTGSTFAGISSVIDSGIKTDWDNLETIYKTYVTSTNTKTAAFINDGEITLKGLNQSVTNQYIHTSNAVLISMNSGKITLDYSGTNGTNNAVFVVSPAANGTGHHQNIMYNSGEIYVKTPQSAVFIMDNSPNAAGDGNTGVETGFAINTGVIQVTGGNNIGVYLKDLHKSPSGFVTHFTDYIEFTGNNNVGYYIATNSYEENSYANEINYDKIEGTFMAKFNGGTLNAGIYTKMGIDLDKHDIILDGTISSLGVSMHSDMNSLSLGNSVVYLGTGTIDIKGTGTKNVGLYAANGHVNSEGVINVLSGTENTAAFATNGKTINILGTTGAINSNFATSNSKLVIADGGTVNLGDITDKANYSIALSGTGSVALVAKNNGVINLSSTSVTHTNSPTTGISPNGDQGIIISTTAGSIDKYIVRADSINVTSGIGIYIEGTTTSTAINAKNTHLIVNGQTAVYHNGGNIDLSNSLIDFTGDRSYAVYSNSTVGTVNLKGTDIILRGKAIGINKGSGNLTFSGTSGEQTRLIMMSNDAIAYSESNIATNLYINASTKLKDYFTVTGLDIYAGSGNNGVTWYDQYAIAAVDGATINIDKDIDKNATKAGDEDTFFYYRRFIGQKIKLYVDSGKTVTAQMSTGNVNGFNRFNGEVIALTGNSSTTANVTNGVLDTLIENNGSIIADRTDLFGNGGIGIYMNFGTVDNKGTIDVQMYHGGTNAIGIVSVGGSVTTNNGVIKVGGDNAIGVLGQAERIDSGNNQLSNEFGSSISGQGTITITNAASKTIDVSKNSSGTTTKATVGIYADNNKSGANNTTSTVTNDGIIIVGDHNGSDSSIGIYGKKTTINLNTTSNIATGDKSIGVYAENDSKVLGSNLGTFNLGEGSVGIYLDETSNITPLTSNMKLLHAGTTLNLFGIVFKGNGTLAILGTLSAVVHPVNIDVDATNIINGSVFVGTDSVIINSDGHLRLGTTGSAQGATDNIVGIHTLTGGVGINNGQIDLEAGQALGLYTNSGVVANRGAGTINVKTGGTQAAIAVEGVFTYDDPTLLLPAKIHSGGYAYNNGTINLNAQGSVGIYVNDGASAVLNGSGINFNNIDSYGVVLKGNSTNNSILNIGNDEIANLATVFGYTPVWSDVVHNPGTSLTDNILVLGTGYTDINNRTAENGKMFVVGNAGISAPDGTIGVYLEGNNNSYTDVRTNNSKLYVYDNGIGIYSHGNNILSLNTEVYNTQADKTVGAYLYGHNNLISGDVKVSGNASGTPVYNAMGIYVNKDIVSNSTGVATIDTSGLNLTIADGGTGMYLESDSYATGGLVTVTNSGSNYNIGLYYTTGLNSTGATITHGTDINIHGNQVVGIYADGGINLANGNAISYSGNNNVGVFVNSNSVYTSSSTVDNISTVNSIGIYVVDGKGINNGTLTVNNASSAAMMVESIGAAEIVNNAGKSIVVSNGVGMGINGIPVTGTATGKNDGTITITSMTSDVAVGVYIEGSKSTFDGTNSLINVNGSNNIGLVLKETAGSQVVDAGVISLGTVNSLGVYANGSVVDFDVTLTGDGTGVYAMASTTPTSSIITGNIDGSGLNSGATALYVKGNEADVVLNGSTITTGTDGVGVYFENDYKLTNTTINSQNSSTGIYINNGTNFELNAGAIINVGNNSSGLYVDGTGIGTTTLETNGGVLNLNNNSIGVFNNGSAATSDLGVSGALTVNFNGTNGILAFNQYGNLNIGNNLVINGDGTIGFTYNGNMTTAHNNIIVTSGEIGFLSKFDNTALSPANYLLSNNGTITVNAGGIGMAIENDNSSPFTLGTLTLANTGTINVDGTNAVGLYSNTGIIDNSTGTITVDNSGVGVFASGVNNTSQVTSVDMGTTNVTNGVGLVIDGTSTGTNTSSPNLTGTINLSVGTATNYNIGTYFLNYDGNITSLPTTATSDYTITAAIEGGINDLTLPVNVAGANKNEIGVYAKNSNTILSGNVTVAGDENIGVYGDSATITTNTVTVSTTSAYNAVSPYLESSIGMFLTGGSTGTITNTVANDNSIGIYGGNNTTLNLTNISAGYRAIGVYANASTVNVSNSINIGVSGYGVFADDSDVYATTGLNMTVADGTAIGILSQGDGDVLYNGHISVDPKDATGTNKASIGIYKGNGTGIVNANDNGTAWSIGKGGYGVYLENKNYTGAGVATINNSADMILGESAVGIYAGGNGAATAKVNNYGTITTGTTYLGITPPADHSNHHEHLNSVGIYVGNGANGINYGTINVYEDHSVGVYAVGQGTLFVNVTGGTINVDNGGVGILARDGATIENRGTIYLGGNEAACGTETIGIAAYGRTETIIDQVTGLSTTVELTTTVDNYGTITVDGTGTGIYGNKYAELTNQTSGVINITAAGGTGMLGYEGRVINKGTINVASGAVGTAHTSSDPISHGTITIADDGVVVINNQFIHAGKLEADNVIVNGAYVSIANATGDPMFVVDTISGDINLMPDFITTGNGYGWTVPNFISNVSNGMGGSVTANTLNIITSPLFVAHLTDKGSLAVAKQPYAYLVAGSQFDNLYNGVDSLLALDQDGNGVDSQILKNLNSYLDNIYNTQGEDAFFSESERTLAEMRGDIYATIQKRMQTIQGAFDSSFDELLNSYNFTRDTGKYSVIYQQGDFEDKTIGIDDYDYRIQGLLYMKENEGRKFGNKWGYSFGFAVSRFDFDDAPTFGDKSKEDVYSVRAGIHNVHSFGEDDNMRLVSRLELGYNRHEATRTLELDRVYKNEGKYDSYQVTLDNRFEKDFYKSLTTTVKGYVALNLEYGYVAGFTEKAKGDSGLLLKVKSNDYFSVEGEVGVNVTKRVHLGKKISMKLTGDLAYGHEFGTNYDRNKARVSKGTEGYYNLIKPEEEKGHVKGRVGVTFEKANNYGVTFDVEARKHSNKDKADVRYGVKFNYKF